MPFRGSTVTEQTNDPLDGFRSRTRDAYESLEEEVRSWRALAADDVDLRNLQDIIKMDNLLKELEGGSTTIKRLVTYASQRIGEACALWVQSGDPTALPVIAAHRNARAARLLLDWIDDHIRAGKAAESQILLNEDEGYE